MHSMRKEEAKAAPKIRRLARTQALLSVRAIPELRLDGVVIVEEGRERL